MVDAIDAVVNFVLDVHAQPVWVQVWVAWMVVVIVGVPVAMRKYGAARRDYLLVAASTVVLIVAVPLWHSHVGYVRLVGLPHIPVWTPLAVYLIARRKHLSSPGDCAWRSTSSWRRSSPRSPSTTRMPFATCSASERR